MADRLAGTILSEVSRSFEIQSLEIFNINKVVAGEFYEVYRGVVAPSEFTGMVDELTSGPCMVMALASKCVPAPLFIRDAPLWRLLCTVCSKIHESQSSLNQPVSHVQELLTKRSSPCDAASFCNLVGVSE
jgi:hypothetical protein